MQHQNQPSENEYEIIPEEESEKPSNSKVCFFLSFLARFITCTIFNLCSLLYSKFFIAGLNKQ